MKSMIPLKSRLSSTALAVAASLFAPLPASAQAQYDDPASSDPGGSDFSTEAANDDGFPSDDSALDDSSSNDAAANDSAVDDSAANDVAAEDFERDGADETGAGEPLPEDTAQPSPGDETGADYRDGENTRGKPFIGFAPPLNPARIENETLSLRLGLFAQPQFEAVGAPDAQKSAKNIYLRNIGLIVSGTLFQHLEYFFDVNYPNLFKADPFNQTGGTSKNSPGLNVQDAIVTLKPFGHTRFADALKLDAGFMLPALSHNALQGAFTLYSWDFFINTYRRNVLTQADPFKSNGQSPQGRDAGAQLRGLLLGNHLEYRVGLFQGLRVGPLPSSQGNEAEVGSVNFFRVAARVQVNILEAEEGFFYQGSYLGEKKILSLGAYYDFQDEYVSAGGDAFVDLPLGPGVLTAQANVMYWDGGDFIQTLPRHLAVMGEAGYIIQPLMFGPILRMEYLSPFDPTDQTPSEARYGGGVAFWPWGHTSNFKAFYTYVKRDPAPEPFNQVNVQWQVYF